MGGGGTHRGQVRAGRMIGPGTGGGLVVCLIERNRRWEPVGQSTVVPRRAIVVGGRVEARLAAAVVVEVAGRLALDAAAEGIVTSRVHRGRAVEGLIIQHLFVLRGHGGDESSEQEDGGL